MTKSNDNILYFGFLLLLIHSLILFGLPHSELSLPIVSERTWGYHFIKFFPFPIIILFYTIGTCVCIPPINLMITKLFSNLIHNIVVDKILRRKNCLIALLVGCSIIVFWILRQKYPFLGDGVNRVNDHVIRKGSRSFSLYYYVYIVFKKIITFNSNTEYLQLINCLLGGLYIYILFLISDLLGENRYEKIIYMGASLFTGTLQFFFGYIEIYNFITIFLLFYFYTSFLTINDRIHIVIPILLFYIAYHAHDITIIFLPSLGYLLYQKIMSRYRIFRNKFFFLLIGVISIGIGLLCFLKFKGTLLRLFPDANRTAAIFTFEHVNEFINSQILAAPAGVILCVLLIPFLFQKKKSNNLIINFLIISSICSLLYVFTANFLRGSQDWDLMMFSGFPITILGIKLLFHYKDVLLNKEIALIVLTFAFLNTASFIVINHTDLSILREEEIISNDSGDIFFNMPYIYLSKIFGDQGLDDKSFKYAFKARNLYLKNPISYYNFGNELLKRDSLDRAITEFNNTLSLDSLYAKALIGIGVSYEKKGNLDSAIIAFQKVLKLDSTQVVAHINLGIIFNKIGLKEKAQKEFQKAVTMDAGYAAEFFAPAYADAHYQLGMIYMGKGLLKEAITELQKAIEYNPTFKEAHLNLGGVYFTKGLTEQSIKEYKQVIKLAPTYAEAYFNLGIAYDQIGLKKNAITEFKKALEINPKYAEAYINLGKAYFDIGSVDMAIKNYRKVITMNLKYAEAYNNLGAALIHKGFIEEAICKFKKALEIDSSYAIAHYNISSAYYSKQNYILAWKHIQAAQLYGYNEGSKLIDSIKKAVSNSH